MKQTLTEKTNLSLVMPRLEAKLTRYGFGDGELFVVKETLQKYHSILNAEGSGKICSRFEKTITANNGKKITIIGMSSSQQSILGRLFGS